jgi:hypothetical protein
MFSLLWVPHPCDVFVLVARVGKHKSIPVVFIFHKLGAHTSAGAPGLDFETGESMNSMELLHPVGNLVIADEHLVPKIFLP